MNLLLSVICIDVYNLNTYHEKKVQFYVGTIYLYTKLTNEQNLKQLDKFQPPTEVEPVTSSYAGERACALQHVGTFILSPHQRPFSLSGCNHKDITILLSKI